jgi:ATP-dependent helicase/nuclease subunit A
VDSLAAASERIRYADFRLRYRDAIDDVLPVDEMEEEAGVVFDAEAAAHGELLHALLERVSRYPDAHGSLPDVPTVLRWFPLAGAGAPNARERWQQQVEAAVADLRAMLEAPALRELMFPPDAMSARNEVELYDGRGRLLRIDRLVEFDDRVVIVDYKLRLLPQEHAGYREQLARYMAAVAPMFQGKRIEAGVATAAGEWIDVESLRGSASPIATTQQGSLF